MPVTKKTLIGTVDLTPTWTEILPGLLEAYTNGTAHSRWVALEELKRLAVIADVYVAEAKAKKAEGRSHA